MPPVKPIRDESSAASSRNPAKDKDGVGCAIHKEEKKKKKRKENMPFLRITQIIHTLVW